MIVRASIYLVACLVVGLSLATTARAVPSAPDVLVIAVDTLAARHLKIYSASGVATPNIERLAAEGAVFRRAYSTAPWTKPSFTSLSTSLLPSEHGVTRIDSPVPDSLTMMPEIFRATGYRTVGIVSHTLLSPKTGFRQGFDDYSLVPIGSDVHRAVTSGLVSDQAIAALSSTPVDRPLFLFAHYFDPHYNYQNHPEFDLSSSYRGTLKPGMTIRALRERIRKLSVEDVTYLTNLYREEIRFTDYHIGRLLDALAKRKRSTIVVFTADHGEEFMEHGWLGHTRTLYEELIHVPLIIAQPGVIAAQSSDRVVSVIDVLPTLADLVPGLGKRADWRGISLVPILKGEKVGEHPAYAEVDYRSDRGDLNAHARAVIDEKWKLVQYPNPTYTTPREELFKLSRDPLEKAPNSTNSDQLEKLRKDMAKAWHDTSATSLREPATVPTPAALEPTPEEVEQLKSLGYM